MGLETGDQEEAEHWRGGLCFSLYKGRCMVTGTSPHSKYVERSRQVGWDGMLPRLNLAMSRSVSLELAAGDKEI